MVVRTPVKRMSIKIRKPIHKEYCNCWNMKIYSIDGIPHLVVGDYFSIEEMQAFLDSVDCCVGFYFSQPINKCKDKIMLALDKGLPVTIETKTVLPNDVLEGLRRVPHSAIHVSINFLEDFPRKRLEPGSSDIFSLREMMFLAKSWKIFVALCIDYKPHLVPKLDVYEIVDITKNYVSHAFLRFPTVPDEEFYEVKYQWEAIKPSSIELFKQYYMPNVPDRTWEIRPKYERMFINELQEYLKCKKIDMEVVKSHDSSNRIRHEMSGLSELPLGMKPFFYEKVDGVFKETEMTPDQRCQKCEKPIFF
jgi:hypothetical protein